MDVGSTWMDVVVVFGETATAAATAAVVRPSAWAVKLRTLISENERRGDV